MGEGKIFRFPGGSDGEPDWEEGADAARLIELLALDKYKEMLRVLAGAKGGPRSFSTPEKAALLELEKDTAEQLAERVSSSSEEDWKARPQYFQALADEINRRLGKLWSSRENKSDDEL